MGGLTRRHGERCDGWWLRPLFVATEPSGHLSHTKHLRFEWTEGGTGDGWLGSCVRAREETGQSQQSMDRFVSPRAAVHAGCTSERRRDAGSYVRRALHNRYAGCAPGDPARGLAFGTYYQAAGV